MSGIHQHRDPGKINSSRHSSNEFIKDNQNPATLYKGCKTNQAMDKVTAYLPARMHGKL